MFRTCVCNCLSFNVSSRRLASVLFLSKHVYNSGVGAEGFWSGLTSDSEGLTSASTGWKNLGNVDDFGASVVLISFRSTRGGQL